jgi:hypothetical protein
MGVILVGSSVLSGKELARITAPVIMIPELPEDCKGKIGLLDPSAATLFISPDLATLTRYSKAWHGLDNRLVDLRAVRADGHLFRWRCDLSGTLECRADGWLLDCRGQTATDTEEGWYERFCDVADVAEGQSIMALVSWERTTMDHLSFRSMLRGLYRAAVYGSFSVLIGGVGPTLSDAQGTNPRRKTRRCSPQWIKSGERESQICAIDAEYLAVAQL